MTEHTDSSQPIDPGAPRPSFHDANGIRHHVLEWPADTGSPARGTILLCHGFLDFAWSWVKVAVPLARQGYRVLAFDWRGHGESSWVDASGYYHFADYVLDLERLLPQLVDEGEQVHLVGHSMGATACAMFAGVRSERLASLALLEGLGPPSAKLETAPDRFKSWFNSTARVAGKKRTRIAGMDDALRRMRVQNSRLDETLGRFLAEKATKALDDEGGRAWRFDPRHRTTSPMPFRSGMFEAFLARVEVQTLVVMATDGYRLPREEEQRRFGALPEARMIEVEGCGHMIHWFAAGALVDAILDHLGED